MSEPSRLLFLSDKQHYSYHQQLQNGLIVTVDIAYGEEKFLSFQEGLIEEYLGDMIDNLTYDDLTVEETRKIMQTNLSSLNEKLFSFSQRIEDVDFFPLTGAISVFHDSVLMTSMIGKVSLFIMREGKILYAVANERNQDKGIDVFSDFIEGEVTSDDSILLMGVQHEEILSKRDKKDIEQFLVAGQGDLVSYVGEMLSAKAHPHDVGLIVSYDFSEGVSLFRHVGHIDEKKIFSLFQKNKYYIVISAIVFVTIFLLYSLVQNAYQTQHVATYVNENGESVEVSPSSIQRQIARFENLDEASKDKAVLYKQIIQDIEFLENQGERPQSVKDLKITINNLYLKGFSIVTIGDKDILSDIQTYSYIYPFNTDEKTLLGVPHSLYFNESLYVGGKNGALLDAISETQRGIPVSFSKETTGCHQDLTRAGLYCYGNNDITRVTKAGTEPVSQAGGNFVGPIEGLGLYNNNNMYVLSNNPALTSDNVYITRYRNTPGSYIDFGEGLMYGSPFSGSELTSMHIDNGTFLTREPGEKKLYQMWREGVSTDLTMREIYILGSEFDIIREGLSADISVMSTDASKYVYLYDAQQQKFVVFSTQPTKVQNQKAYNLSYLFALSFEMTNNVLSTYVVEQPGNTYLYLLTEQGVYQVKLSAFISQYEG